MQLLTVTELGEDSEEQVEFEKREWSFGGDDMELFIYRRTTCCDVVIDVQLLGNDYLLKQMSFKNVELEEAVSQAIAHYELITDLARSSYKLAVLTGDKSAIDCRHWQEYVWRGHFEDE